MAFDTPMDSLTNESEFGSDDEEEDEDDEDIVESFNKLFIESVKLEKTNKRLKRENKELTEKSKSLEITISQIQLNPLMEKNKGNEQTNEYEIFLTKKGELYDKVKSLETKLNEIRMLHYIEKENRKVEKKKLVEDNANLTKKDCRT